MRSTAERVVQSERMAAYGCGIVCLLAGAASHADSTDAEAAKRAFAQRRRRGMVVGTKRTRCSHSRCQAEGPWSSGCTSGSERRSPTQRGSSLPACMLIKSDSKEGCRFEIGDGAPAGSSEIRVSSLECLPFVPPPRPPTRRARRRSKHVYLRGKAERLELLRRPPRRGASVWRGGDAVTNGWNCISKQLVYSSYIWHSHRCSQPQTRRFGDGSSPLNERTPECSLPHVACPETPRHLPCKLFASGRSLRS